VSATGGIVLAGGRSTRMGTAKAGLDWHGEPIVAHVARSLAPAIGGGPVVVVGAPGQVLPALPAGVRVAVDATEGRGPLQGLVAGLAALPSGVERAVVVATDQPFVAGAVARLLAADPAAAAVAFRSGERLQPLGARYARRLAAVAADRLAAGEASLRGLLEAVGATVLDATPAEAAALRSLDTPAAYAAALAEPLRPGAAGQRRGR
jgi:molybdopterin-guanine dinucleotide biosynthesis protein A